MILSVVSSQYVHLFSITIAATAAISAIALIVSIAAAAIAVFAAKNATAIIFVEVFLLLLTYCFGFLYHLRFVYAQLFQPLLF